MSTNITSINFDDGEQINVVRADGNYTWVTTKLAYSDWGVWLEYHDDGANKDYRLFLPWSSVDRIYQEL